MKTIFECETEIGKCDYESLRGQGYYYAEPEFGTVYAHTKAYLNGSKRLLKVEQRCYMRSGEEFPDQPWVKPEMILEPAWGSEEQMAKVAGEMHEQYILRAREKCPEQYFIEH